MANINSSSLGILSNGEMHVNGGVHVSINGTTCHRCNSDCVDYQPYRPLELIKIDTSVIPTPFACRENVLQSIKDALALETGCARIAILVGMGGAGKSTLARVYAKNEQKVNPYTNMIWIDAEAEESIKTALEPVLKAGTHRRTENADRTDDISAIYAILKNRTLLVFDNVDDAEMIQSYLPTTVNAEVEILITSRKTHDWGKLSYNVVKVGVLERSACEVYIRAKLSKSLIEVPDVCRYWEDLARHFGYLAIALESATSAIVAEARLRRTSSRPFTIAEFLQIIQSADLLDMKDDEYDPAEKTYKPLRQLWIVTFKKLADLKFGGLGLRILNSLAFFSPNGVSSEWFSIMFKDKDPRDVSLALDLLDSWSLAEVTQDKQCVIHRVLRETLLSRLWADELHRREFYTWFLPAVQGLYSKLRLERRLKKFYVSLKVILCCLEKEEKYISLIVPFFAYMEHRGDVRCHLYLENLLRRALRISTGRNDEDIEVLDQLIEAKFKIGSLLPVYADHAKNHQPLQTTLEKVCKALKGFAYLSGNACAKVPETVVEVFETALLEHELTELLSKFKLFDLVNPVLISLQIISKSIESSSAHGQDNICQVVAVTNAIGDILAKLLRFFNILKQPVQAQFAVLKGIMWWNWVAKCVTELGDSSQDPFAARGLTTVFQDLLRCGFKMEDSNVSAFCTVLSMSGNCYPDSEVEVNIKGHTLAAINEIINPCRTNQCKDVRCKVLDLLLDFVETHKNFGKCMLPIMVIYIGIDAHVTIFESEKDNHVHVLLKTMKNKLGFCVKDDEHYNLAMAWRISNIENVLKSFTCSKPQEEKRTSNASVVLDMLMDESNDLSTPTVDTFHSDVAQKGYNNETTFSRFESVLEFGFKTREGGDIHSFLQTTVQASMKEFHEADSKERRFLCKCIHTNYQLLFAQHCVTCDRMTKALILAEQVLNHRLYCYKSTEIETVVDLMIKVWYATETTEQDAEDRIHDLLFQVDQAQEEYFSSSFYKREACYSKGRFIQFLCHSGAVEEAVVESRKLVASLKGPDRFVLPTSCLIVLHTLLLRDNQNQLLDLIMDWESVFERDFNSRIMLKVLKFIARRDIPDCDTIELDKPFTEVFAFRPLLDARWSRHVLNWMQRNLSNLHKSELLFKDKSWMEWIITSFQDETVKLCCGKSDEAVDDAIFYYQTLEILIFGKRKKILKAVKEAENKLKCPDGSGLNYKFTDALTRGATRTIVHEYRSERLWFQQSGGSGRTRFLQRNAQVSDNPSKENDPCHIM